MRTKNSFPENVAVYRALIPVTENLIKTNNFKIYIDLQPKTDYGYLVGLPLKTDTNPLSDNYGRIKD
jgi:hypothetical protein